MTEKEKQIEEIAKDLKQIKYSIPDEIDDRYRVITHLDKRGAKEFAASLAEAGYRKQSDTVKEFVCKVLQIGSKLPLCLFNEYKEGYTDCLDQIKELAAQYGVEVEE